MPILAGILSVAVFGLFDAIIKLLLEEYPVGLIASLRWYAGVVFTAALFLWRPRRITRAAVRYSFIWGALTSLSALTGFLTLKYLPLADAAAIGYTNPLCVALLAWLMLRERPDSGVWGGLAVGFVGVLIILYGQFGSAGGEFALLGVLMGIASNLTFALSSIVIRKYNINDPSHTTLFLQTLATAIILSPFSVLQWEPVDMRATALILLCGLLGAAANFLMIWALKRIRAVSVAILDYTQLIWAALFGWLLFAQLPTWTTWAGAVAIIAGCVLAVPDAAKTTREMLETLRALVTGGRDAPIGARDSRTNTEDGP